MTREELVSQIHNRHQVAYRYHDEVLACEEIRELADGVMVDGFTVVGNRGWEFVICFDKTLVRGREGYEFIGCNSSLELGQLATTATGWGSALREAQKTLVRFDGTEICWHKKTVMVE